MPQSESLVSKLREDAHLDCRSKPDNPAESVVVVVVVDDIEEIRLTKWTIPHITALGNCIDPLFPVMLLIVWQISILFDCFGPFLCLTIK